MKRGAERFAVVGLTAIPVISGAEQRIGLRLSPPGAGRVTLSTNSGVIIDQGLTLTAGMQPLYICPNCVGDLVGDQWWAVADAAGRTIGIFEVHEL